MGDPVDAINQARVIRGFEAWASSESLRTISRENDHDEMIRNEDGHFTVLMFAGYAWGQVAAEKCPTPQDAVNKWLNSPAHRDIILSSLYTTCGMDGDPASGYWTATASN